MADLVVDGMTRVFFVPTIANTSAPTVAELNAGTNLTPSSTVGGLTADGLQGFEASPGEVDNTALASTFDTKLPGVPSFSNTRLMVKKQATGDTVFTALTTFGTSAYVVVRRNVLNTTAWATSQSVQVYPVTTGSFDFVAPERNTVSRYWVATPISAAPVYNAVTA